MDRFIVKDQNSLLSSPVSSGDCMAAAAQAAASDLLFRIRFENIIVFHGTSSRIYPVKRIDENCNLKQSEYSCVVEGAAPPDIKDRAEIRVCVSYIEDFNNISDKAHVDPRFANLFLVGGEGIGTASGGRPGYLDGEALVEKPVRDSVFETVANVCDISDGAQLLLITVSCPGGMMIAAGNTMGQTTFAGGITIMGEHATISKIHQRDISDSIDFQIKKQVDYGVNSVLVSPGNYCADKINSQLHVPLTTAAHCYNYPGQAIDSCVSYGVTNMLLVGNVGKLVKLAAGITNTNSFASDGRREIFAAHTAIIGGTSSQVRTVMHCLTCDEILALLTTWGIRDRVMSSIMNSIAEYCTIRSRGRLNLAVALFSEEFGLLGSTINTKNVLVKVSQEQFALSLKLK
ncbi:MAG: cobalt-precorrin-5B (C(1))-methyltransferase [Butyrivibrio sp.]|uniref:cobalt-precorrin-5B (C(1))-methyltransferase n=1 Tax=Butyrivibrio sp. TaxID=28121 RepID=UPI0025C56FB8|nr:cobalt-precorrin-5B (C(1))-methyltransferase [Butyrivibrio sp.]MBQ6588070.1 cobalt-precorrin-5B (C(1))-methyltransferase [Butyrivibrio sp.]